MNFRAPGSSRISTWATWCFTVIPQDWIHNLGKRIAKVHLKDFKRLEDGYRWVNLGEGDIDWPAVRKAFADVGYTGYATTELEGGDEAYLRDVGKRVDRLVLGMSLGLRYNAW